MAIKTLFEWVAKYFYSLLFLSFKFDFSFYYGGLLVYVWLLNGSFGFKLPENMSSYLYS